jgi:hypothetical protein
VSKFHFIRAEMRVFVEGRGAGVTFGFKAALVEAAHPHPGEDKTSATIKATRRFFKTPFLMNQIGVACSKTGALTGALLLLLHFALEIRLHLIGCDHRGDTPLAIGTLAIHNSPSG